jgi:ribonucleoside-diphosphate reductase alpha chain
MQDYYWLNTDSRTFLKRGYLQEGQEPEERFREIAEAAESILKISGYADKFESYLKKGWYSLASPIIANFGTNRGLPISCNSCYLADSIEDILTKQAEVGMMTKYGAGTAGYFGEIRPRGSTISVGGNTSGSIHFMELFDNVTEIISQSNVRRGSFAAYLPVDHGDIQEFLTIKSEGHPIQNMSIGVCISDQWMKDMLGGKKENRKIWSKIIQKRFESGFPYIFFTDNANNNKPQVYKDKNFQIYSSQLCSEIALPTNRDLSFVCDLASKNLVHYEEWKNTDSVKVLLQFLDAVMTEYIEKTSKIKFMERANKFAREHRAVGIGSLGWHSFLQSKMIPFESMQAKYLNTEIHSYIKDQCDEGNEELAALYGEPEVLKGYGKRCTTTMAIAPTTSSSFILGQVSQSIEPLNSNYFIKDLAKGKFTYKNPYLTDLLKRYNKNDKNIWKDILIRGGSVQHLDFLTQEEKYVFKTFGEISQKEIVIQAAQRQKYIDQSQSLNLMIDSKTPAKQVSDLMIFAWEQGIKSLYYQRGTNPAQQNVRDILNCKSCEA